jgi:hypothetical protein
MTNVIIYKIIWQTDVKMAGKCPPNNAFKVAIYLVISLTLLKSTHFSTRKRSGFERALLELIGYKL